MSGTFDPSSDFAAVVDGTESVTMRRTDASETIVANVLRRAATTREAEPTEGQVQQADAVFHLPIANLATPPAPGEAIIDSDAVVWTVLAVARHVITGRWRCTARNVVIAAGLDNRVTIQIAQFTAGSHGSAEPIWVDWKVNLPARIQPLATTPGNPQQRLAPEQTHVVYVVEELALADLARVVDADGKIYRVERFERAERIGQPARLLVRQIE